MLTLNAIKSEVENLISTLNIEIIPSDRVEVFNKPSCFITFDNMKKTMIDQSNFVRDLRVRIKYYPTDETNYIGEIINVQDQLESLFNVYITIQDRHILFQSMTSRVIDGILQLDFDLTFDDYEDHEQTLEYMSELYLEV